MGARAIITTLPVIIKKQREEEIYREYMAKCARICTENTARFCGGNYVTVDLPDALREQKKDNRTGEEIAADIIKRAGIEVIA